MLYSKTLEMLLQFKSYRDYQLSFMKSLMKAVLTKPVFKELEPAIYIQPIESSICCAFFITQASKASSGTNPDILITTEDFTFYTLTETQNGGRSITPRIPFGNLASQIFQALSRYICEQ